MKIYENFKEVIKIVQEVDNMELYEKILNLQAQVQELSQTLLEKEKLIKQKENKIDKIKNKLEFKDKLILKNGAYFELNEEKNPTGSPYCPKCWEVDKVAVHIHQHPLERTISQCPKCNATYNYIRPINNTNKT